MRNAVIILRVPQMFNLLRRSSRLVRSLPVFLFLLGSAWAADWGAPEQQLAQKIVAITGPTAVSLDVANRSSLSQTDVEAIRTALRTQLNAAGLTFVNPDQAAATVQVSLSENLQNYVWVARIQQGNNQPAITMISMARSEERRVGKECRSRWAQDD